MSHSSLHRAFISAVCFSSFLVWLYACTSNSTARLTALPQPTLTQTPVFTPTPTLLRTETPSPAPALPTASTSVASCTPLVGLTTDGGQVSHNGIRFSVDPTLAKSFEAQDCPLVPGMDPSASHPTHTLFTVPSYTKHGTFFRPEIKVVAVTDENRQAYNGFIYPPLARMGDLQTLLTEPPQPVLWFEGVPLAVPLQVHSRFVVFQNGAGVRAVVEYAQDFFFFTNNALLYAFDGLTRDGRYYVGIRFPIEAPFLISIENSDPLTNTNSRAIPISDWPNEYDEQRRVIEAYNQEAFRRFDQMTDADFTPSLTTLDALVASLRIEPPP